VTCTLFHLSDNATISLRHNLQPDTHTPLCALHTLDNSKPLLPISGHLRGKQHELGSTIYCITLPLFQPKLPSSRLCSQTLDHFDALDRHNGNKTQGKAFHTTLGSLVPFIPPFDPLLWLRLIGEPSKPRLRNSNSYSSITRVLNFS